MAVFQLTPTEDAERLASVVETSFEEKDRYILPGKVEMRRKLSRRAVKLHEASLLAWKNVPVLFFE